MEISRRRLLTSSAAAALGVMAGCRSSRTVSASVGVTSTSNPAPAGASSAAAPPAYPDDRKLVVVQMSGGNDALNTLVPLEGRYHDLRPTLGLADTELLAVAGNDRVGLHPAMASLAEAVVEVLGGNHLAVIPSVGFPNPDRSHFAALDMWWSASERPTTTGWLGRWLDLTATGDDSPLKAVALGGSVPALRAEGALFTSVMEPSSFLLKPPQGSDAALLDAWEEMGGDLHRAARQAVDTFDALGNAGSLLATAGELLVAEPAVQVVHVNVGGFDTHAGQLDTHAQLLDEVAAGIAALLTTVADGGLAEDVLVMTTSEFGRRAGENASAGTDHGKAGLQFLVGSGVSGGVYGGWDLSSLDDGDLRPSVDPREVYAAALAWMRGPIDEVLGGSYSPVPALT